MKFKGIIGLVSAFILLNSTLSFACDELIKSNRQECEIQDRYQKLKNDYAKLNIDIEFIAEYRALRFYGRPTWEEAVASNKEIDQIYKPAPGTWLDWSRGAAFLEELPVNSEFSADYSLIKDMNYYSISKENMFKRPRSRGERICPGEIRNKSKESTGWFYKNRKSARMARKIIKELGDDIKSPVKIDGKYAEYVKPKYVLRELKKWYKGSQEYLEEVAQGKMGPMAAGGLLQRWLVTIHPFYDGNGRSSRLVQDFISKKYNMPFAATGDLHNEILTKGNQYVQNVYETSLKMMNLLDTCLDYHNGLEMVFAPGMAYRCEVLPHLELTEPSECKN